jgi:hypothetical protein
MERLKARVTHVCVYVKKIYSWIIHKPCNPHMDNQEFTVPVIQHICNDPQNCTVTYPGRP